ncbi:HAD family hydrolase [Corynebacterium phocae]|uniref:HAD family hydrolase n=1 Tax=Corynebacterium phocae TaxID=161895 RepID=A0A1L7D5L1_9CORY|nr:Cof-type HAD-IIB family hydrolase [Corynebacterium phocae]APT93429.1 HAD family hydrolase [Corynebacterium phocae]KAA8721123.1 Cof-type HAD-IIB family hydrolase [Corynebacterium phocae]
MLEGRPAPRLIASDIDGTLLDSNHRVSKRTREVLLRAVGAGAHFALSTGRPFRWVAPVLEQLPIRPLCVASNGAVIYDSSTDKVVLAHELAPAELKEIATAAIAAFDGHGGVSFAAERSAESSQVPVEELYLVDPSYSENAIYDGFGVASREDLLAQPCVKLMLRNHVLSATQMFELLSAHLDPGMAHITYAIDDGLLELSSPGVTKAKGVAWLAAHYGVEQEDTIAFGDMPNDVEMLRWAGLGVAMDNATAAVKDAADMVTAANHQAGVAKVLERWF